MSVREKTSHEYCIKHLTLWNHPWQLFSITALTIQKQFALKKKKEKRDLTNTMLTASPMPQLITATVAVTAYYSKPNTKYWVCFLFLSPPITLSKILTNETRRYICNIYSHWLIPCIYRKQALNPHKLPIIINSLRPVNVIWSQRSLSTLVHETACCHTAQSRHQNRCRLFTN